MAYKTDIIRNLITYNLRKTMNHIMWIINCFQAGVHSFIVIADLQFLST